MFKIPPKARNHDLQGCRPAPAQILGNTVNYVLMIVFCVYFASDFDVPNCANQWSHWALLILREIQGKSFCFDLDV